MRSVWFWPPVLLASAAFLVIFWLINVPLGVPGEWVWRRHGVTPDVIANLLLGCLVGTAYVAAATWGYRRLARPACSRGEALAWQLVSAIMAAAWIVTVQGTGGSGATIARWPFVLYYPSSSGYFFKARYEIPHARQLLKQYEELMQGGDVLHVGTHPPGLFLLFHGLIDVVASSSSSVAAINATQPAIVRETFDILQRNTEDAARKGVTIAPPLNDVDRAVLWLAGLLSLVLSVATVWPLYAFLRHFADRPASWACAVAWPLVPAIAVFLPKSDVAYAFPAMLLACFWIAAWRRSSPWLGALAGGLWSLSLFCSLAFLPVALWLALMSLFESWPAWRSGQNREELRRAARTIIPAAATIFAVLAGISIWGEIPLWRTFWLNYQNHAGFYVKYPRTYLSWLAVNPLELAGGLGAPVAVAASFGIGFALTKSRNEPRDSLWGVCLSTLIVWGWLWLSGKNSGEAARLWIFLMPFFVACCAPLWAAPCTNDAPRRNPWPVAAWLACQAVVGLLTVQRINGFAVDGL